MNLRIEPAISKFPRQVAPCEAICRSPVEEPPRSRQLHPEYFSTWKSQIAMLEMTCRGSGILRSVMTRRTKLDAALGDLGTRAGLLPDGLRDAVQKDGEDHDAEPPLEPLS